MRRKPDARRLPHPQATIVDVVVATPRNISNVIEANGNVVANEYVELHPENIGRFTYLNVPEGTQVTKGTIIARINDADLQATLEKLKALLDLYQKTEERDRKLLDINGMNQSDYDLAVNNVKSTKADIDYTPAQIDKTLIRAPFDGVVGLRQVSPGAYATPATIIATVQQLDKIKVDFTLPEQYTSAIKKGSLVDVLIDASSNIHRKALIIANRAPDQPYQPQPEGQGPARRWERPSRRFRKGPCECRHRKAGHHGADQQYHTR